LKKRASFNPARAGRKAFFHALYTQEKRIFFQKSLTCNSQEQAVNWVIKEPSNIFEIFKNIT